mmetsp:Transcript_13225/g.28233  ORF Transcript_13225/g.28233 Transcript_13225/m.28233 type:complete len:200 (-) Transcript_13225:326-925(-)
MRTSEGWEPPVKGWTDTSMRPRAGSKPRASAISRHMAACLAGSHSGPPRRAGWMSWREGSCATLSAMRRMSGVRSALTAAKMSARRSADMRGSKESMAASYRGMSGLVMRQISLRSSMVSLRMGANILKSSCSRALTHMPYAVVSSSAAREARDEGMRRFRSKRNFASRRLAFMTSSIGSPDDSISRIRRPISSSVFVS